MNRLSRSIWCCPILLSLLSIGYPAAAAESTLSGFQVKRGVNISHWLSQSSTRGEKRRAWFLEKDVQFIAQHGYDHIRLPIDEEQLWDESGQKEPEAFELLHNGLKWAQKHDLRVIIDLHVLRSHHFNAEERPLWTNPEAQEQFLELWRVLSSELRVYPVDCVAYELMNEPVADDPEDWNRLVAKGIAVIRENEPHRVIVVGSNKWQSIDTMTDLKVPEGDKNILLSFHFYDPFLVTHHQASWTHIAKYRGPIHYPGQLVEPQDVEGLPADVKRVVRNAGIQNRETLNRRIVTAVSLARKRQLPIYCGEWGCIKSTPRDVRLAWYRDMVSIMQEHQIGWANWDYKGGFGIRQRDGQPDAELIEILTGKAP